MWNPVTNQVSKIRDVIFLQRMFYKGQNSDIKKFYKNLKENSSNGKVHYMLFTLEPEPLDKFNEYNNLSAKISIYDALGNNVILHQKMPFIRKEKKCIFIWDCKNSSGRLVGDGSYTAHVEYDKLFDTNHEITHDEKSIFQNVGIQK